MTHLMIVEDHEENRTLLKMLLEANGYRVTAAGDGIEALAAARRDLPDAIVSDVLMPKMDGFALCRAWMKDAKLRAIPFIFYSATFVDPKDEQFALALGAVRYLIKPVTAEVLLRELRAMLQHSAGPAAPGPATPLDDMTYHSLHESALARKIEDKAAQLESANRETRMGEARFRTLFERMLNGFAYCKMQYDDRDRPVDFVYLEVNDAFERLTGLKDVVGRKVSEVIPGITELSPELFEIYGRVASTGIPEQFEFDFKSFSKWLMISVYSPETGYFVAIFDDITERKVAAERLRESEQQLRAIFDGALDGIVVAEVESKKFLAANSAICSMLGYTHEEMLDIGVPDIHPIQGLPRVVEHFNRLLSGDLLLAIDMPLMRKDGSVFYADIKAAPIRLGGKDAVLGVFRDVSERIKSEQQLIEAEALYRGLIEQSIAGTYIVQDGKFVYVNPRYAEIFGYGSADELIGRDVSLIVSENDREVMMKNIRRRIEGEIATINYDFVGLRKDGSMVDIGVHGARATHHGRPAVVGMIQDISEKKRAEDEIKRYVAQLESAFMSTVEVATTLGEMRDPYTAGHQRRVAEIAVAIGVELGFDKRRQEGLRVAGYLHDIGKITIPAEILSKPAKLSPIEFQLIQGHPKAAFDVLKNVKFPWPVAEVALQHHEHLDGSGYPQGLKGEAILLEARIIAVADVIEAMSSHRPYRAGLGIDVALAEIERGRGTAYDPAVADACLRLFREGGYHIPA